MRRLTIGLLYTGNETNWIWGSSVTTFYLARALERIGHSTWRASVTEADSWKGAALETTDLLILKEFHDVTSPVSFGTAVRSRYSGG